MQDRYLFRGKRLDNGEWAYGSLAQVISTTPFNHEATPSSYIWEIPCTETLKAVETSTIGQCTGLRDENGKLVFEGDILGGKSELVNLRGEVTGRFEESAYLVVWRDEKASFYTQRIKSSQHASAKVPEKEMEPSGTLWITLQFYPHIGNIHDNPELLEAQP